MSYYITWSGDQRNMSERCAENEQEMISRWAQKIGSNISKTLRSLRGFRHRLWTFYRVHAKSAAGFFTHRPRGLLVFYCGLRGLRVDFARNPHRLRGLRMYSWWTLYARSPCGLSVFYCRLRADFVWTPRRLWGLHADSARTTWTPHSKWTPRTPRGLHGLRVDSTNSAWTPRELRAESVWNLCGLLWTSAEVRGLRKTNSATEFCTLGDSALIPQKKVHGIHEDSARVKDPRWIFCRVRGTPWTSTGVRTNSAESVQIPSGVYQDSIGHKVAEILPKRR